MEFWIERYASDHDIRVEPIVMTADQAEDYPKAPDSGAVELDAMEELSPGRLGAIVRENVAQFRDADLAHKIHEKAREAQEIVEEAVRDTIADELDEIEEVKSEAEEIYERYRARLQDLSVTMEEELSQAIREKLAVLKLDLPPLPEPEANPKDEGWLFDSRRDYREQFRHYKDRSV